VNKTGCTAQLLLFVPSCVFARHNLSPHEARFVVFASKPRPMPACGYWPLGNVTAASLHVLISCQRIQGRSVRENHLGQAQIWGAGLQGIAHDGNHVAHLE
jgi:hypothetical protein